MIYDQPFEVTKEQLNRLQKYYSGCFAWRESEGKYYVKVWLRKYFNQ